MQLILGLVSVLKDGQVVLKIITSYHGERARAVAKTIRKMKRVPTMKEARHIAENAGFGNRNVRVVITKGNLHLFEQGWNFYSTSFHDPWYNPLGNKYYEAYFEVVNL